MTWLTVALFVLAAVIGAVKLGAGKYLESFFGELGKSHAQRLGASRVVRRRTKQRELAAANLGTTRRLELETGAAFQAGPAQLGNIYLSVPGPFAGRRPAYLILGSSATDRARVIQAGLPASQTYREVLVACSRSHEAYPGIVYFDGSPLEQVGQAIARADRCLREGRVDYLAIVLQLPLSDTFEADATNSLESLLPHLLAPVRNVWMTWLDPIDVSAWPEQVVVESTRESNIGLRSRLVAAGYAPETDLTLSGSGIEMRRESAARAVLCLLGDRDGRLVRSVGEASPDYGARIQLALGSAAVTELRARVDRVENGSALGPVSDIRLRYVANGKTEQVEAKTLVRQNVAYLVIDKDESQTISTDAVTLEAFSILEFAILTRDELLAVSPLAVAGRAWIESADSDRYRSIIQESAAIFEKESAAASWSYFLLTLDRMLREGTSQPGDFLGEPAERARAHGLSELFEAEAMEFARVGGRHDDACERANLLMPKLFQTGPRGDLTDRRYVLGTANFLIANLLRNGGLYVDAESWIRRSLKILDPSRPSMAVEYLHCQYALGVCANMQGRAILQDLSGDPNGGVFARALVTLNNANTSWIVGDLQAALAYGESASKSFEMIQYRKYAQRARDLVACIDMWRKLEKGQYYDLQRFEWRIWNQLVTANGGTTIDLSALRPSRALGALQAAGMFRRIDSDVRIALPRTLQKSIEGQLAWRELGVCDSVNDADSILRDAMGIGPGTRVPLLAD